MSLHRVWWFEWEMPCIGSNKWTFEEIMELGRSRSLTGGISPMWAQTLRVYSLSPGLVHALWLGMWSPSFWLFSHCLPLVAMSPHYSGLRALKPQGAFIPIYRSLCLSMYMYTYTYMYSHCILSQQQQQTKQLRHRATSFTNHNNRLKDVLVQKGLTRGC